MGQEKTMKLSLLFIAMDVLTLLAYPIVFIYGKLGQFSKSKENIPVPSLVVAVTATPER